MRIKRPKLVLAAAILLLGGIMGVAFQDDLFVAFGFATMGMVIFIPIVLVVGVIAIAQVKVTYSLVMGTSCFLSLFVFVETGRLLNLWKVDAVESYVARAVLILDQLKSRQGSYPASLPISALGEPPILLRQDGEYSSDGTKFCFTYIDEPAGWAGGEGALKFDSVERKWVNDR